MLLFRCVHLMCTFLHKVESPFQGSCSVFQCLDPSMLCRLGSKYYTFWSLRHQSMFFLLAQLQRAKGMGLGLISFGLPSYLFRISLLPRMGIWWSSWKMGVLVYQALSTFLLVIWYQPIFPSRNFFFFWSVLSPPSPSGPLEWFTFIVLTLLWF